MRYLRVLAWFLCLSAVVVLAAPAAAYDVYANSQDGNPIPDVDKPDRDGNGSWPDANDNSCWAGAAANLLAAAGWGVGAGQNASAQTRADRIYGQLCANNAWQVCNNAGQAMQNWIVSTGQNPASADYDLNNPYTNVNIVQKTLGQPDYNKLLNDLAATQVIYSTVLFRVGAVGHFLTLIGGDHDNAQPPANTKQSVWHDSDRDQGGADDNAYTNNFGGAGGKWDLSNYVALAADEYDQISRPGVHFVATSVAYYYHARYLDMATGQVSYCTAGAKASAYGDPIFQTDTVLHVGNEFDQTKQKKIALLIDYAESANMTVEQQIYLLDDQNNRWDPTITPGADAGQVLFEWELPYQPSEELIVFPSDKYKTLDLDVANGYDVIGWQLTSECVPEPFTMSLLALGALGLLVRKGRK